MSNDSMTLSEIIHTYATKYVALCAPAPELNRELTEQEMAQFTTFRCALFVAFISGISQGAAIIDVGKDENTPITPQDINSAIQEIADKYKFSRTPPKQTSNEPS